MNNYQAEFEIQPSHNHLGCALYLVCLYKDTTRGSALTLNTENQDLEVRTLQKSVQYSVAKENRKVQCRKTEQGRKLLDAGIR